MTQRDGSIPADRLDAELRWLGDRAPDADSVPIQYPESDSDSVRSETESDSVRVYPIAVDPTCDMLEDCREPVSMIDQKGYAYCTEHGMERRFYQPCRKLRPWELRRLQRGLPLNRY